MCKSICKRILFKWLGWTEEVTVPHREKCIICVAPHTSNLDFLIGELYYAAIGRRAGFLMKKSWFFWPLGPIFRRLGGIPVDRSRHGSLTDALAEAAKTSEHFELAVTPEGTRKRVERWKRGFYFIAQKANLPIQLFAIDYRNKRIVCTRELMPSEDFDADWRTIMDYYAPYEGTERHAGFFQVERADHFTP